jgi:hypothetical protein
VPNGDTNSVCPLIYFSSPLAKLLPAGSRVNWRLTLAIAHCDDDGDGFREESPEELRREQGAESHLVHLSILGRSSLGASRSQIKAASSCSNSTARGNKYNLCIGTFGAIPIDGELEVSNQSRIIGPGSSSSSAQNSCSGFESASSAERAARRSVGGLRQDQPDAFISDIAQASMEREGKQSPVSTLGCSASGE